ncbi:N-acetylmuramoyl-L-alanine amidase CwlD [uncultured Clostridium sp.]|uniref:N-acetylmuramoyl-L-alanine amidase CwlD n=1 Tax=uncultured Clostridium sp. TaxID=59620 RepID=UPI0028E69F0B|nr:N-acetylmuramoyl-L-alanine amidase CwlD [uncultured Clostridium sp.]
MFVKNKKIVFVTIIIVFTIMLAYNMQAKTKVIDQEERIILIDPGHGGIDGGAVSPNGTIEKDINLSISLMLKEELQKRGYKVAMTREEDNGLNGEKGTVREKKIEDLNNRCKMKKESNCSMFISVHLNIFPQSKYYGAQVWYSGNDNSKKLASLIQSNFKQNLDQTNNRMEKAANNDYKILRGVDEIPSVIVECGFLSNYEEEKKLKDRDYQLKIAQIIADSVNEYYNNN